MSGRNKLSVVVLRALWLVLCLFVDCNGQVTGYLLYLYWPLLIFVLIRASDKCQKEKRKTVNGDDLLWAMATLGFEDYLEPLKIYLARYREVCCFDSLNMP